MKNTYLVVFKDGTIVTTEDLEPYKDMLAEGAILIIDPKLLMSLCPIHNVWEPLSTDVELGINSDVTPILCHDYDEIDFKVNHEQHLQLEDIRKRQNVVLELMLKAGIPNLKAVEVRGRKGEHPLLAELSDLMDAADSVFKEAVKVEQVGTAKDSNSTLH